MQLQRISLIGSLRGYHSAARGAPGTASSGSLGQACRKNTLRRRLRRSRLAPQVCAQPRRQAAAEKNVALVAYGRPRVVRIGKIRVAKIYSELNTIVSGRCQRRLVTAPRKSYFTCSVTVAVVFTDGRIRQAREREINVTGPVARNLSDVLQFFRIRIQSQFGGVSEATNQSASIVANFDQAFGTKSRNCELLIWKGNDASRSEHWDFRNE